MTSPKSKLAALSCCTHDIGHAAPFKAAPHPSIRICAAMGLIICSCLAGGDKGKWRCPSTEPMMASQAPEADASAHFGLCLSHSPSVVGTKPAMCANVIKPAMRANLPIIKLGSANSAAFGTRI